MVLMSVQVHFCDIRINVRRIFLGQQTNNIIDKPLELRADLVLRIVLHPK